SLYCLRNGPLSIHPFGRHLARKLPGTLSLGYCPPVRCHGPVTNWTESATPNGRLSRVPPPGVRTEGSSPRAEVTRPDSPKPEGHGWQQLDGARRADRGTFE